MNIIYIMGHFESPLDTHKRILQEFLNFASNRCPTDLNSEILWYFSMHSYCYIIFKLDKELNSNDIFNLYDFRRNYNRLWHV